MRCRASATSASRSRCGRCRSRRSACSPPSSCTRWRASCRAAFALTADRLRLQRRRVGAAPDHGDHRRSRTVVDRVPAPDGLLQPDHRRARRDDARAGQRPARAVGARAGAVRRVGLAPRPLPRRRRRLGGGAGRPSRRHPARVRDPLPGLSLRAGRSVPQARADADRDRRDRLRRLHRRHHAAVRTVRGRRAAGAVGRHVAGVAVAAPQDRPLRRSVAARPRRLCRAAVEHRPDAAGAELDRRRARHRVRAAGAGARGAATSGGSKISGATVATAAR